jgi:hypothetical protein
MEEVPDTELYDAINEEERGDIGHRTRPEEYCVIGDYLWFKDVPDDTYQVNVRYFPNFIPLTAGDNLPFRNLFNQEIAQGVLVCAKNRNELPVQIDVILKDIFLTKQYQLHLNGVRQLCNSFRRKGLGERCDNVEKINTGTISAVATSSYFFWGFSTRA